MIFKSRSDPLDEIREILQSEIHEGEPLIKGVFIDETLREFFYLNDSMFVPSLPVSRIDHVNVRDILHSLAGRIPAFLSGHEYLENQNPASEQHSIHLGSVISGRVIDIIHMLRLDFKFSANSGKIIKQGDTGLYPSYTTDRIYFRSRLVPVLKGSRVVPMNVIRLRELIEVETDRRLFTSVLFDDFSSREISMELSRKAGDVFSIPVTVYPMIYYDYFTACLNKPYPSAERLTRACRLFEPLFIFLYADTHGCGEKFVAEGLEAWTDALELSGCSLRIKPEFIKVLVSGFSCYSVMSDEVLMLKGWRRIVIPELNS